MITLTQEISIPSDIWGPREIEAIAAEMVAFELKIKSLWEDGELPFLGINFIVTRENFEGLVPFSKELKDAGVENIRFSSFFGARPGWDLTSEVRLMKLITCTL